MSVKAAKLSSLLMDTLKIALPANAYLATSFKQTRIPISLSARDLRTAPIAISQTPL